MKQNLFLLTLCALLLSSQLVAAPFYDLALYTSHEDNIGRGEGENNRLSDNIINYSARASFPVALPAHATLTINSGIQWFDYQRHSGFDHLNYDIGVKYRIKPDLHFTSPWYSLGIKLSHDEYDTSELSNNNAISVDVMTGKRLTDRVLVKLGLNYKTNVQQRIKSGILELPYLIWRHPKHLLVLIIFIINLYYICNTRFRLVILFHLGELSRFH